MLRERAGLQLIPTSALSGSIRAGKNILTPVTHRDCGSRVGDLGCITHSFRGLELQGQMRYLNITPVLKAEPRVLRCPL